MLEAVLFYPLAAFILGFGVLVVTARNTVHSVMFLVANFLCVAVVFVMLAAEFLAVIQVLVYAGGIVVLYLFVVMLVNLSRREGVPADTRRQSRLGFILAAILLAEVSAILVYTAGRPAPLPVHGPEGPLGVTGNTETIGMLLYTDYLVPFEVASMLLLVAMIGAIILARKEV
ncbi:NADH-quinone oxidoreductase subunit J [soil metagenome]|nr:NADH-quinone oxidoreductase subunit J [Acidobacteriota bacterium]